MSKPSPGLKLFWAIFGLVVEIGLFAWAAIGFLLGAYEKAACLLLLLITIRLYAVTDRMTSRNPEQP